MQQTGLEAGSVGQGTESSQTESQSHSQRQKQILNVILHFDKKAFYFLRPERVTI